MRIVVALGWHGNKYAVKPLMRRLNEDTNSQVRSWIAWALGEIGDKWAVDSLIIALNDADKWVRRSAAMALGDIGDVRAVGQLIAVRNDIDQDVKEAAEDAIRKFAYALGDHKRSSRDK